MTMTLDEAIKHAEEVAEKNERICQIIPEHSASAFHCAEQHRQLAEWLKDYKSLLNGKVKTAKWKHAYDECMPYLYCSNCGLDVGLYESTNYCPNCGAKMEGGLNK